MMSEYTPDKWVVIKSTKGPQIIYKILATWSGGYLDGDSWRMNSGITGCKADGDYYLFEGNSGSIYKCHKDAYGMSLTALGVWARIYEAAPTFDATVELMNENQDWLGWNWTV